MPFANSDITDIIATTIQQRSGELADNTTNNNGILRRLKAKGNVRPFGGGNVILEEIKELIVVTVPGSSAPEKAAKPNANNPRKSMGK